MKTIHPFVPADPDASRNRADAVIAWLRDYAETRINSLLWDERRCVPPYVILDFGNHGLFGMQVPEAYGGLALTNRDFLRVLEQLAAIDISLASLVFIHNGNGVRPILGYAKPELRDALLPVLASGRELSAFGLTEPAAGSNLPGLETRAAPDGEGRWKLYGVKRWNASGWAGVFSVFARVVDEKGRLGHVIGFVLQQGMPGLHYGPESLTMGMRGIMQNALYLDGVEVDESRLLGAPGDGMEIVEEAILIARISTCAIALGGLKRCAQVMIRFAERRRVSTGRLLDSPITLDKLSETMRRIAALEALTEPLVRILDAGGYPPDEACMAAKVLGSDYVWEAADDLVQTLGGRGYMENNPGPMILRDCRALRIGEGANEFLTLSIGRRVGHSAAMETFFSETLGCPDHHAEMVVVAEQTMARVLADAARFASRSAAVAWAHTLIGRFALWALQEAALEAALRTAHSDLKMRARDWAAARKDAARRDALSGLPTERLRLDADTLRASVADLSAAIGDVELTPPGCEVEIDPLLRRDPVVAPKPDFGRLPGNASGAVGKPSSTQPEKTADAAADNRRRVADMLIDRGVFPSS